MPADRGSFTDALRELKANKSLLYLTLAFSSYIGLYFSLGNVVSAVFHPFGFGPLDISMVGIVMLGCGIIGAGLIGVIIDKT